jgi:hypothetical protein
MALEPRLNASVKIRAMRQMAEQQGGFATVIRKGDETSGAILVQWLRNGRIPVLFEQMPSFDEPGEWRIIQEQDIENKEKYSDYLDRRWQRDSDIWVIELDIADEKRLVGLLEHFR